MPWYLTIVMLLLLVIALATIVVVMFWESSLILTRAPFIPIPPEVLPSIIQALELDRAKMVCDLGCGEGRVLLACHQANPQTKLMGVERSWLPYLMARYKLRKVAQDKLRLIRGNFFKSQINEADRVFVYLFPGLMNDLLPKLTKELKPGTLVVSCDFEFKGKEPKNVISLNRPPKVLGQKLLVYEF